MKIFLSLSISSVHIIREPVSTSNNWRYSSNRSGPNLPLSLLFLLFLFLFLSFAPGASANTKVDTRISGLITNRISDHVEVSFPDNFITFKEKRFTLKLDREGFFEVTFFFEQQREITLVHGKRQYRLFLEPGDNLFMKLDCRMVSSIPFFEGQGAANNNFFAAYQKQFRKYTNAFIRSKMASLEHIQFTSFINTLRKEKLNYYSAKNYDVTKSFNAHLLADIDYWWAYQLLQYRWEHPADEGEDLPLKLPETYYSFLAELEIQWEAAMSNPYYVYFISEFLSFKEERRREASPGEFVNPPYKNASMYLSGKPLAYIMASELYMMLKRNKHHMHETEIRTFILDTPYREYSEVVKEAYEMTRKIQPGQLAPDFKVVDKDGNTVRLSDFRGKVVYLDFWATWCPPCLKELPYSRQLARSFAGENIVFIYVSLDVNVYNWKEYMKKNNLSGHHYFAEGVYDSAVAKDYFLKALPNFMLINQDGVVIKNPAKRPSQNGVRAEIRSALGNYRR